MVNRLLFTPSVASSELICTASLQTMFAVEGEFEDEYTIKTELREIQVESIFTEVRVHNCTSWLQPCLMAFSLKKISQSAIFLSSN